MANDEHVAVVKQGTEAISAWLKQYPDQRLKLDMTNLDGIDLSGANLTGANLTGTSLREANLREANLREANLSTAILSTAILSRADLTRADLSGADLTGANLTGANLTGTSLREAILSTANLREADLSRADLSRADLSEAILSTANLREADLSEAILSTANLSEAILSRADLTRANLSEAILSRADLTRATLSEADLRDAYLSEADLRDAYLCKADLREANLSTADLRDANLSEANLSTANLSTANLREAILSKADLSKADLSKADLSKADLREANLRTANLREVRGAHQAYGIETTRFMLITHKSAGTDIALGQQSLEMTPTQATTDHTNDAFYFETCIRLWPERWLDWEHLRIVGRLPLFGASYTALILIPIIFYGLALYNDQVVLVRAWAEQIMVQPGHLLHQLASLVLVRFHPRPIPRLSFLLLLSTVLLAIGTTLYTFFCPSRVKEFSRDQWCDQIGRSLLHYWPLAWKYRQIRLLCAMCYALGGTGALWVLGSKVWNAARFILKYSALS